MFVRTVSAAALSCLVWTMPASAAGLASVLPEDSKLFFEVRNLPKIGSVSGHPIAEKFLASETGKPLRGILESFREDAPDTVEALSAKIREETGLTLPELLSKFTGAAAVSLTVPFADAVADEIDPAETGILLVADFAGDAELANKLVSLAPSYRKSEPDDEDDDDDDDEKPWADWPGGYEETESEIEGATVRKWALRNPDKFRGMPLAVSVAGGRLFLGVGRMDVDEAVRRQQRNNEDGSLSATQAYRTISEGAGEWDVLFGANLESILSEVREGIRRRMEGGDTGGMPINLLQLWEGLGVKQFRTAFAAFDLQDALLDTRVAVTYDGKPAILNWYAATGPGEAPLFVSSEADDLTWGTLDWGRMFDELRKIAASAGPMIGGGLEMGLNSVKTNSGVDIREHLLGQMGDNLWSVSRSSGDAGLVSIESTDDDEGASVSADVSGNDSAVIGIALRDARAFQLSLTSLINSLAPGKALFDDREYLGSTIHRVREIPPPMEVAWLIRDDTLILSFGKPDLLEALLSGMEKRPSEPLVTREHIRQAFAELPDGHLSSSITDPSIYVQTLIEGLKMIGDEVDETVPETMQEIIDRLPEKTEVPAVLISRFYVNDRDASMRMRLIQKP